LRKPSDAETEATSPARRVRPRWSSAIFVCGKCLKRHDDGKTMRRALKQAVRPPQSEDMKRSKVRIVKTACLGLCPRGAVIVASAATLSAGDVMLVKDAEAMAAAVPRLLPGVGADAGITTTTLERHASAIPDTSRQ
jgi:hypothetical protein